VATAFDQLANRLLNDSDRVLWEFTSPSDTTVVTAHETTVPQATRQELVFSSGMNKLLTLVVLHPCGHANGTHSLQAYWTDPATRRTAHLGWSSVNNTVQVFRDRHCRTCKPVDTDEADQLVKALKIVLGELFFDQLMQPASSETSDTPDGELVDA
jgi:hypothetical protein